MKNVSVILNIVLVVAVAILFVLHFSSSSKSGGTNDANNSKNDSTMVIKDIAYVQIDSLISKYDLYHDLKTEFEKNAQQKDADFTAKGRSFQNELQKYQNDMSIGLITRSQAEEVEKNLQIRQNDLQKMGEKIRTELAEQEAVMLRQVNDVVMKYIEKYNSDKKFTLILNASSSNTINSMVLYGHPGMNITDELVKGLNEEYIQNRPNTATTK